MLVYTYRGLQRSAEDFKIEGIFAMDFVELLKADGLKCVRCKVSASTQTPAPSGRKLTGMTRKLGLPVLRQ